jgi:cytochrome o ubiquinol oxidase subunit 1
MLGFALVWYIWWLASLSFVGILAVAIRHTFNYDRDYIVPAEDVVRVRKSADSAAFSRGLSRCTR